MIGSLFTLAGNALSAIGHALERPTCAAAADLLTEIESETEVLEPLCRCDYEATGWHHYNCPAHDISDCPICPCTPQTSAVPPRREGPGPETPAGPGHPTSDDDCPGCSDFACPGPSTSLGVADVSQDTAASEPRGADAATELASGGGGIRPYGGSTRTSELLNAADDALGHYGVMMERTRRDALGIQLPAPAQWLSDLRADLRDRAAQFAAIDD